MLALGPERGGLYVRDRFAAAFSPSTEGRAKPPTALGYTPYQTFRHIIMPQALRVSFIPPIGKPDDLDV